MKAADDPHFSVCSIADIWASFEGALKDDTPAPMMDLLRDMFYAGFDASMHCVAFSGPMSIEETAERFIALLQEMREFKLARKARMEAM